MKNQFPEYIFYTILFVLYSVLAVAVFPTKDFSSDTVYWVRWATYIQQHGFTNTYELADNNYNPLYQYILWVYVRLVDGADLERHIYLLKVLTLPFDFIGALFASSFVADRRQRFFCTLLLLLNVGYVYNTLVWGQVDAIYTCLVFIAIVLSLREQPVWSVLFFVLALNAKFQALVLLPVLLLLWVPQWVRRPTAIPLALLTAFGVQLLLLLPFLLAHGTEYFARISENTIGSIEYFPVVSMYCFNGWFLFLLTQRDMHLVPDSLSFVGLTYRYWGVLLFGLSSAVVLLPLAMVSVRNTLARQRFSPADYALLFLSTGLVVVLFIYFNTQMHSRYVHASVLLLGAYAFITRRYLLLLITSGAYFLNMEAMTNIFAFYNLKLAWNPLFNSRFIAVLYTLVVVGGIREIYQHYNPRQYLSGIVSEGYLQWPLVLAAGKKRAKAKGTTGLQG